MNEGDRVKMISFKGRTYAPTPLNPESLLELLLGSTGTVVMDPEGSSIYSGSGHEKRVLVQFDSDLYDYGLHNDNPVPNALWIPESDLVLI